MPVIGANVRFPPILPLVQRQLSTHSRHWRSVRFRPFPDTSGLSACDPLRIIALRTCGLIRMACWTGQRPKM